MHLANFPAIGLHEFYSRQPAEETQLEVIDTFLHAFLIHMAVRTPGILYYRKKVFNANVW